MPSSGGLLTSTRAGLALTALLVLFGLVALSALLRPASASGTQALQLQSDGATLAAVVEIPDAAARPLPAVVLVHGSGRVTATDMLASSGRRLKAMGLAVLAYDKRGVGGSTGEYTMIGPANSDRMFGLLAADALAGVEALRARKDIDPRRIGLVGVSQAGWIAPLAASRSPRVAFVVTISGPAVTVGEEIAYSRLAGEDPGSIQGLSDDEISRRMRDFSGPHGYDPLPALRAMTAPSLWILGERDRSIPLQKTVATLTRLGAEGKPVTTRVYPGLNHSLRNPSTGERPDIWQAVESWLRDRGVLR
jgi:dipeptidyl aminopeptidase/acylaminoacyl peptidase